MPVRRRPDRRAARVDSSSAPLPCSSLRTGFSCLFYHRRKGPPDWDYGSFPDVPAQSVYSTYPYREHAGPPEPQHVNQKPPEATMGMAESKNPAANKGVREGRPLKSNRLMNAAVCSCFFLLPRGCDYARMYDQESVRTYKKEMPVDGREDVPVEGGSRPSSRRTRRPLKNPLPSTPESLGEGNRHTAITASIVTGRKRTAWGTVGQSFSPLPTDLRSDEVQSQGDGELYAKIRLGYMRHPRLYTTISERDTWAVIDFIRSLPGKK